MAINWIAPHGNFSKTLSEMKQPWLLHCTWLFTQKWIAIAVCQVFQALYREWVLTESLQRARSWNWEWNAFWRKKSVCNFKYCTRTHKYDTNMITREEKMTVCYMFRMDTRYWFYVEIYYILCSTFCFLESRHYFMINISVMQ